MLARAITAPGSQRLTRGSNHDHLAAIWIVFYLAFSVPVVAAGVATTHFGLHQTAEVYSAVLAVLAAAAAGIFLFRGRSLPRGPAQRQHEQGRTADPQGQGR